MVGATPRFFGDLFQIVAAVGGGGLCHLQQGGDDLLGSATFRLLQQEACIRLLLLADLVRFGELGMKISAEQFGVALFDLRAARDRLPLGLDSRLGKNPTHSSLQVQRHHEDAASLLAGTAGASTAVGVVFNVGGNVRMDNHADSRDVDSAGSHIGSDEDLLFAVTERIESAGSLCLGQFTTERRGGESLGGETLGQICRIDPATHKDQHPFPFGVQQHVDEGPFQFTGADQMGDVLDVGVGFPESGAFDDQRVLLKTIGEFLHRLREGGGDQMAVAFLGQVFDDGFQLFTESHVEHLVRFVEDYLANGTAAQITCANVIEQPAGGTDQHRRRFFQGALFTDRIGSAGDHLDGNSGNFGQQPAQLLGNLDRQFTGGGDQQGSGAFRLRQRFTAVRLGEQITGEAKSKSESFAGTGLRRDPQVAAFSLGGEHCFLYGGQFFKTAGLDGRTQGGRNLGKGVDRFHHCLSR